MMVLSRLVPISSRGLAGFALLACLSTDALACSCRYTVDAILKHAAVIFTGVAQGSEYRPLSGESGLRSRSHMVTTFRVERGYRGVKGGDLVRVRHARARPGNCGTTFKVGETYSLPASRGNDGATLFTNSCYIWKARSRWKEVIGRLERDRP